LLRRLWEKIKLLWKLAKSERASPREIGWAVFIGAFAGCTPAVGVHGPLAMALATIFKKNRLFAWLGSRISNMVFLPFIALAEVQVAHRLRAGTWLDLDRQHALDRAGELLLDWCLGTIPVGFAIGGVMGLGAWGLAHRRDTRRARATGSAPAPASASASASATPSPAGPPPPSSGSPS